MTDFISPAQIDAAATAIRNRTRYQPTVGLVLGSGLSGLADSINNPDIIPYEEIPNWPVSTVHGHSGRLAGTNAKEGLAILAEADMETAVSLTDAARKSVAAAKGA